MPYYEIESALTYNFTSGDYVLFSSGGVASKCNVYSGAHVSIGPKGAASGTSVFSGGHMAFLSGSLPGKDNKVLTGGVLSVGLGTQPGNIDAANGAILQLTMGGTWFVQRPTDYVIASNGTQIKKTGTTSTTSDGIVYAGYTGWDMKTPGCTLNIVDFASAAFVKVSSGCSLGLGGGHGYGAGAAGRIDVYSGGSAVLEKANYVGLATVHSGGTMTLGAYSENTTVMENGGYLYIPDESILLPDLYPDYDLNVRIKPNTFKDLVLSGPYQSATAHSGTVASHVTLKGSAGLDVFDGGKAVNTVLSSGYLTVESGGVASGVSMADSGFVMVSGGGMLTGQLDFGTGTVYVEDGGIVDFDISALKGGNAVLLTNYNMIPVNSGELRNTITVSAETQAKGSYALATKAYSLSLDSEYRSEQQKIFAICGKDGSKLGAVMIGTKALVGDRTYALNLSGSGDLSLTVAAYAEGDEIWTDSRPDSDDGRNNNLFVSKIKYVLPEYARKLDSTPIKPAPGVTPVLLDRKLAITVNNQTYRNYVGEGDGADFAKITLEKSARLSFSVGATGSAKFTVWKAVPLEEDGEFKVEAVKSVSAKKATAKAAEYTASTGPLLLESGVYYVSMEASEKKGSRAYYNVSVDQEKVFLKSDNSDDWGNVKDMGPGGEVDNKTVGTLKAAPSKVVTGGWVGCGDAVDYKKFRLDTAANLVFHVKAGDASKFAVYCLNGPKKERYSLKSLLSSKLSKNPLYGQDGEPAYQTVTKALLLEAGNYYLCMTSANAAKGGDADYDILLDPSTVFYDKTDDRKNDVLVDSKKNLVGVCETISLGLTSKAVQMDRVAVNCGKWKNFVGHNDDTDYAKIKLSQDLTASFTVEANDAAKFTLYKLVKKGEKYSLKAIQSKTLKKQDGVYAATLSGKLDKDEDYYLCMKSTNAKKGGNAYYNVSYEYVSQDKDALLGPEAEANAWNGAGIEPGAADSGFADAFAADSAVLSDAFASDAVPADVLADAGFMTLSGADLAEMAMPASCDPAVSPVPVAASDDIFAGLLA